MLWLASEILFAALRTEVVGSAITIERVSSRYRLGPIDHHTARRIFNLAGLHCQSCLAAPRWYDLFVRLWLWRRLRVGSQTALGIHKERSRTDDTLAFLEAAHNLDAVREPPPGFDPAGFKDPLAALHEYALLASRVDQSIQGHRQPRRHPHRQLYIHEHVGPQGKTGVVRFEPQLQRPGRRVYLRKGVGHAGRKNSSLVGKSDARHGSRTEVSRFAAKD